MEGNIIGMRKYSVVDSIIGLLYLIAENNKLCALHIGEQDFLKNETLENLDLDTEYPVLKTCAVQLAEYFEGNRIAFDIPLDKNGTSFQQDVWKQLETIPYGKTCSYQDVAEAVGRPKAVRAVGQANKSNKIPIVVPCHRVIGKNQTLTGYAGTRTDIKDVLLRHEGASFKK